MEEVYFIGMGAYGTYDEKNNFEEMEENRARFEHALHMYKEKKEIYEKLYEHELIVEEMINNLEKENKDMVNRIKDLRQEIDEEKQLFEKQTERDLQHEFVPQQRCYLIQTEKVEKEIQRLKEENEHMTAELEQLTKYSQEEKQQITTAEQEVKCKMEEIHKVFCKKDDEIKMLTSTETQKMKMIEEKYKIIKDLKEENRELQKQMSDIETEEIVASKNCLLLSETQDSTEQEALRTKSLSEFGMKILGVILIAIMLLIMDFYSIPDLSDNIRITVFELVEPYGKLSYPVPPVY